jgi:hypothetical protein
MLPRPDICPHGRHRPQRHARSADTPKVHNFCSVEIADYKHTHYPPPSRARCRAMTSVVENRHLVGRCA